MYEATTFLEKNPLFYFKMAVLSPKMFNFGKKLENLIYSACSPKIWLDPEVALYMKMIARYVTMFIFYVLLSYMPLV
jgi:hypothetical protein